MYGSLLLRGAIAAAQHERRATAHELLDEADEAARQLGRDANLRWTAFGPTNAKLHRVHVAVTLGDAGAAIDLARTIDLNGTSDTYALGVALADRAPFRASIENLRREGVRILLGPGTFEPHPPRTGDTVTDSYPWHLALDEAHRLLDSLPQSQLPGTHAGGDRSP